MSLMADVLSRSAQLRRKSGHEGIAMITTHDRTIPTDAHASIRKYPIECDLIERYTFEVAPLREVLYRHAFRLSRNYAGAENLVQETMVKAYVILPAVPTRHKLASLVAACGEQDQGCVRLKRVVGHVA
jgi:hypothetical protein